MAVPQYRGSLSVRDSEGHESVMTVYLDGAATYDAARLEMDQLEELVEALTDGIVSNVEISDVIVRDGAVPAGNVDNEIKGQFSFYTADGTVSQLSVPAFKRTLLLPNTSDIDQDAVAVAAFINALLTGTFTDRRASDLVSVKAAQEQFARRRKD